MRKIKAQMTDVTTGHTDSRGLVFFFPILPFLGFPGGSEVKASDRNAGDSGSVPGSGSSPGEGNGSPLQYTCLENPMDGGAWWPTVHGVAKSRTRLSSFTFIFLSFPVCFLFLTSSHPPFLSLRIFFYQNNICTYLKWK